MRDLIAEFKELRLQGMASAWDELAVNGPSTRMEASRWLIEHLLQSEHTDRAMRSISYQMHVAKFPVHRDLAGFDCKRPAVPPVVFARGDALFTLFGSVNYGEKTGASVLAKAS